MTEYAKKVSSEQEKLRLVSGYNDIFVGIACIITFVSLTTLIESKYLDQILVLVTAIALSWYFVRHQRMRFTGIVISIFVALSGLILGFQFFFIDTVNDIPPLPADRVTDLAITIPIMLPFIVSLTISAILSLAFWRFARVPLAHALAIFTILLAILAAVVGTQVLPSTLPDPLDAKEPMPFINPWGEWDTLRGLPILMTCFILGCLVEAYAIWWDMRDPKRQSVATDVAFWTHIVAAPFIVQPLYWWAEDLAWSPTSEVIVGMILFMLLLAFALVINRRALLIGAMVWVLAALFTIADMAVAGLSMGVLLLFIAAAWNKTRELIEPVLPELIQRSFPTLLSDS